LKWGAQNWTEIYSLQEIIGFDMHIITFDMHIITLFENEKKVDI